MGRWNKINLIDTKQLDQLDRKCEFCRKSLNKSKNIKNNHYNKITNKTHYFCSVRCKAQWCYKQAKKVF